MTNEELTARVKVLEERLSRLAGAVLVLLESITTDTQKEAAREIWEALQTDMEPPKT